MVRLGLRWEAVVDLVKGKVENSQDLSKHRYIEIQGSPLNVITFSILDEFHIRSTSSERLSGGRLFQDHLVQDVRYEGGHCGRWRSIASGRQPFVEPRSYDDREGYQAEGTRSCRSVWQTSFRTISVKLTPCMRHSFPTNRAYLHQPRPDRFDSLQCRICHHHPQQRWRESADHLHRGVALVDRVLVERDGGGKSWCEAR